MANNRKAGPITLAIGLIFFGSILLVSNIVGIGIMASALKFWPVLLIGLGLEYFIKSYIYRKNTEQEGYVRFHLPTVIIILLVTLIGYTGQQLTGLFRNQDLSGLVSEAIAGTNFNYKYDFESKPVEVKPGFTKIKVDSQGKLELVPSIDGKLHVKASVIGRGASKQVAENRAKAVKIDINEGEVITISCDSELNPNNRRPTDFALRVMVPKGVNIDIDNGSGSVKADNLQSNMDITAFTGDVALSGIKGNLDTTMNSGNIRINDVSGDVRARNENGMIEVSGTRPVFANYNISNRSGEIILRIPETSNATINASTKQGTINGSLNLKLENVNIVPGQSNSEHPGPGAKGSAILGNGKGSINLSNETGSITIDKN